MGIKDTRIPSVGDDLAEAIKRHGGSELPNDVCQADIREVMVLGIWDS